MSIDSKEKPRSSITLPDDFNHFRCVGGTGITLRTMIGYSLSNPCILAFAIDPVLMPGQMVSITATTPSTMNGQHKVIRKIVGTTNYEIDLDTTDYPPWVSGGVVNGFCIADENTREGAAVSGTTAAIWAGDGYMTPEGDTYAEVSATQLPHLNFDGFTGRLLMGCTFKYAADPSLDEFMFGIGRQQGGVTQPDNASGFYGVQLHTDGHIKFVYRMAAVEDFNVTITRNDLFLAIMTKGAELTIIFDISFSADGQTDSIRGFNNGVETSAASMTPVGAGLTRPYIGVQGLVLGGAYNSSISTPSAILNSSVTPSQTVIKDIFFLKSPTMTAAQAADFVYRWSSNPGEWPEMLEGI